MTDRWLILELGPHAEGEDPDLIRRSIQHVVRNADVFIPAVVTTSGTNRVFQYVVEGYAFVRQDRPQNAFLKLSNTRFVQSVLVDSARRINGACSLATISEAEIDRMRKRIQQEVDQDIAVGDTVLITSGPYKEIEGRVIEDLPETKSVQVYVKLRSKEAIVMLPRSFLQLVAHRIRPKLLDLLPSFQRWVGAAKILATWDASGNVRVVRAFEIWTPLEHQRQKADILSRTYLGAHKLPLDTEPLARAALRWARTRRLSHQLTNLTELTRLSDTAFGVPPALVKAVVPWYKLTRWVENAAQLAHVPIADAHLDVGPIARTALCYRRLYDFQAAWHGVTETMYSLGEQLSLLEDRMLDNVLIDGFNLAFRCRFAPSLRDLKDTHGRPTGIIFGYLRSLASLQKRFPKAVLHVCWDGSSKRRKAAYEGSKANRPARGEDGFDQVGFLRGFLPLIGVVQHWNPDEEADDVIATLVTGSMAQQRNVIVSTDRDLLQLVGRTTIVLTPAVGAGKEKLFDTDAGVDEYGVEPGKLPHLRAMTGDTSDNLPGVVRVPSKILAALVRSHGTVDGIYSSGLPGLTKTQYAKLKEAEAQIRMNADLMTLRVDVSVIRTDPNPDQIAAEARLGDVEVKPEAISVFFGDVAGFYKEAP
jgi:5'-3' exonuclease/transcription antitermination factor NusG